MPKHLQLVAVAFIAGPFAGAALSWRPGGPLEGAALGLGMLLALASFFALVGAIARWADED